MHIRMDADSDNSSTQGLEQLGQDLQSGSSASAAQAYNSLGPNLQAGLISELSATEIGAQTSSLSLTV